MKNEDLKNKWPKIFPPLSSEQVEINNDFVKHWHEVLPSRFSYVDDFNQSYVVKSAPKNFHRTLEIGAGIGEHLKYENLTELQKKNYYAVDIRENMVAEFRDRFPEIQAVVGDCQKRMNFDDGHFDRILAIHVLEHLPNLPEAVKEMHRLCDKARGVLSIVIPCEGSFAYTLARRMSAQRIFEARYKQSYKWFIEREHLSTPAEIFNELSKYFDLTTSSYFPIPLKVEFFNLCIGANLKPKRIGP